MRRKPEPVLCQFKVAFWADEGTEGTTSAALAATLRKAAPPNAQIPIEDISEVEGVAPWYVLRQIPADGTKWNTDVDENIATWETLPPLADIRQVLEENRSNPGFYELRFQYEGFDQLNENLDNNIVHSEYEWDGKNLKED